MDQSDAPHLIVLAGPNGAGKSTAATELLPNYLGVTEFVNADVIAHGLSAFAPEKQAIEAGRIMLRRLRSLAEARASFAFETTLATRSFARWIDGLVANDRYHFELVFFYLPSADMAIDRVAQRVRAGGHYVPADTIRRRYVRGLFNLVELYIPLATTWQVVDNSNSGRARIVASGNGQTNVDVADSRTWNRILQLYEEARHAPQED